MVRNLSEEEILTVIEAADLEDSFNAMDGNCEEVAVAFHRVFGADAIVAVYDEWDDSHAVHAAVRINGTIFDGRGKRTKDGIMNHISYLKPKDFHHGIDSYEKMWEYIEESCYCEFNMDAYDENVFKHHEPTAENIVDHLETTLDELAFAQ